MTIYLCDICKKAHDSARDAPCVVTLTLAFAQPSSNDPKMVGLEIRSLLMSLRHPDHDLNSGYPGHHGTDEMRRRALSVAGICSLDSGELAPECCCGWSSDSGIVRPTKENPYP